MVNITIGKNLTDIASFYTESNTLTGGLMFPMILIVVFLAITILLRTNKLNLAAAGFVCMVLSIAMQSLEWVTGEVTLIFMTLFVIGGAMVILNK